jgi:hypothetical protein
MVDKQKLQIAYQAMSFLVKAIAAMEQNKDTAEVNYNLWRTQTELERMQTYIDESRKL